MNGRRYARLPGCVTSSPDCFRYKVFSLTWPASMQIYWNKESVCIRKEFNSHRIGLEHQHGRRFIFLGHQYGHRDHDVMWKHSCLISNRVGWVQVNLLWNKQHEAHKVKKREQRFTESSSLVLIGPSLYWKTRQKVAANKVHHGKCASITTARS